MKAVIVGIEGMELTPGEVAALKAHPPAGVILFARNIGGAIPLARLVGDLREVLPRDAMLLVDQEGGRVARLGPPDWQAHPAAGAIGTLFLQDQTAATRLAWLTGALMGLDCAAAGFDIVCAPVLDLLTPATTAAIGDRAYGHAPGQVATLAQAMADGLLSAGMQPVGKHAPGHGRATVDSHHALPRLPADADLADDIRVFSACSGLPWMMTAHIVYEGLDPTQPATLSAIVIEGVIRGTIGFDGLLVSDDLAMHALTGTPAERAIAALAAGCDLAMHCSGELADIVGVLRSVPEVSDAALARLIRAQKLADRSRLQLDRPALIVDQAALVERLQAA